MSNEQLPHLEEPLEKHEATVREFHHYLRNKTSLSPGYVVDMKKAAHRLLVNEEDPDTVPNADTAIDKLKEYIEWRDS